MPQIEPTALAAGPCASAFFGEAAVANASGSVFRQSQIGRNDIDGFRVEVAQQDNRFVLNGPHSSLQRDELIPVSKDLALAIRMQTQAEFIKLQRDKNSRLTGFTWLPIGGLPRNAKRLDLKTAE